MDGWGGFEDPTIDRERFEGARMVGVLDMDLLMRLW